MYEDDEVMETAFADAQNVLRRVEVGEPVDGMEVNSALASVEQGWKAWRRLTEREFWDFRIYSVCCKHVVLWYRPDAYRYVTAYGTDPSLAEALLPTWVRASLAPDMRCGKCNRSVAPALERKPFT